MHQILLYLLSIYSYSISICLSANFPASQVMCSFIFFFHFFPLLFFLNIFPVFCVPVLGHTWARLRQKTMNLCAQRSWPIVDTSQWMMRGSFTVGVSDPGINLSSQMEGVGFILELRGWCLSQLLPGSRNPLPTASEPGQPSVCWRSA